MTRALLILNSDEIRRKAKAWIEKAPDGARVEYERPKRTIPQNDKMWTALTVISQHDWKGGRYSPTDWKDHFIHALRGSRWMPGENGDMIPIGRSTSDLSKEEFSDLIELILAFCARQGIVLPWDGEEMR